MRTYPLTSTDPKSPNMLMHQIRRLMRAEGVYPHNADEYTVYLGRGAYSAVCTWLQDADNPTAERIPIRFGEKLRQYQIVIEHEPARKEVTT